MIQYYPLNNVKNRNEVKSMQKDIHPKYEQTQVRCACGAVIDSGYIAFV